VINQELTRAMARKSVVESHPEARPQEVGSPVELALKGRIVKEIA